jgi:hypothetical protein
VLDLTDMGKMIGAFKDTVDSGMSHLATDRREERQDKKEARAHKQTMAQMDHETTRIVEVKQLDNSFALQKMNVNTLRWLVPFLSTIIGAFMALVLYLWRANPTLAAGLILALGGAAPSLFRTLRNSQLRLPAGQSSDPPRELGPGEPREPPSGTS